MATLREIESRATDLRYLDRAIESAQDYLLRHQAPEGYWVAELEADASVTAGYIPIMRLFASIPEARLRKIADSLLSKQCPDGGWPLYYGGPGDLNVSIQVYFALKLAGLSPQEPCMQRARELILSQGGIARANTFTKVFLAIFGQCDWRYTPSLPPEIMFLPRYVPFNLYDFASWARATIVALMIVLTLKPVYQVPPGAALRELYVAETKARLIHSLPQARKLFSLGRLFLWADRLLKLYEKLPAHPVRVRALKRAEEWMLGHQEADGSWGGIMLPWIYSLVAMKSLGYRDDHPALVRALQGMETFIVEDENTFHLQPAVSVVWDTCLAANALRDSGLPADHPSLTRAARWLLEKQVLAEGDWKVHNPHTEPGGWSFEFHNQYYPDMDDTPVVCRALAQINMPDQADKDQAISRGMRWALDMQSKNGGWAAFDRDNDFWLITQIPFAEFMPPLDPTCADVTTHMIEAMGCLGYSRDHPSLRRAIAYLKRSQGPDGAWYGRWGVNYIYGTGLALEALRAVGEDMHAPYIQKAARWLEFHQNADGGWGESGFSYDDPATRGLGPSTASQTAWALLGLVAASGAGSPAVQRGVDYLLHTQQPDGTWSEESFTGSGFPRAFYLRYHWYSKYFPLMALGRYRAALNHLQEAEHNDERHS